jgi:ribokinase
MDERLLMDVDEVKPSLVIVGDAAVDLLAQVESLPGSGEDAVVEHLAILPGGSAANCAAVAARLGCRVKLVGATGEDLFADLLRQDLTQAGVDIGHLRQLPGSTAVVISIIDRSGERTFLSYRGGCGPDYGDIPPRDPAGGDILHVSAMPSRQSLREIWRSA